MVLNYVWIAFFLIGFVVGVIKAVFLGQTGLLADMLNALFDAAKNGFEISLGLAGIMSLWLGIMKVGEKAGADPGAGEMVGVREGGERVGGRAAETVGGTAGVDPGARVREGVREAGARAEGGGEKEKEEDLEEARVGAGVRARVGATVGLGAKEKGMGAGVAARGR